MSLLFNPFNRPSQAGGAAWFHAGPTSSFPNITDAHRVAEQRLCNDKHLPGCKVFHVPRQDSSLATQVAIDEWKDPEAGGNAKDQVMVFQYKGRFVAVDHVIFFFLIHSSFYCVYLYSSFISMFY